MDEDLAAGARKVLAAAGHDPGEIELSRIPGGASRQVYLASDGMQRWVLRRDPPGAGSFNPLELEYRLLGTAVSAGVPAPAPIAFETDGGAFGSAGFLMCHVAGDSVAPRLLRKDKYGRARAALGPQLGETLAHIHAIDPASVDGLPGLDGDDPALAACALWEAELDRTGEPLPGVEAALRWLRLNAPAPPARPALVHGDFRLGNFICDADGLAAVIDWELAHAGDAAEDIGWLVIRSWRFGNDAFPVAGVAGLGPFLDAYEKGGGARPEAHRLHWWQVLGNVKWAVICARQAADHLSGERPSHELASLGRRICEPEWDALTLLGAGTGAGPGSGSA